MGVRRAGAGADRRLLRRAGRRVGRLEPHRLRHLRRREPRQPARGGPRELPPARRRSALLGGAPQHVRVRRRRRAALDRALTRGGGAALGARGAPEGALSHDFFSARRHHPGRHRGRVALHLPPAIRAPEPRARRRRHRSRRLARRSAVRDAGDHPDGGVEELRVQHGDPHRRPAEHPRARLRGGARRRRRRRSTVPLDHAADAGADLRLRARDHDDRLLPALRRALRDDAGRAGARDAQHRLVDVSARLPLVDDGLRGGGRVRALRDHPRADARHVALAWSQRRGGGDVSGRRDARAPAGVSARVRLATPLLYAALVVLAVLTLLPLLWMVSASLMPSGEATASARLLPRTVTLDQYRTLFTRLNVARALANSTVLATAVTAISLVVNALAGYAFAKLRFAGRDRLFRLLLGALVIPAQVAMLPLFLMMRELRLVDTYWGVIVPGMASIFGIFLVRQYALSIPQSLLDAARIDGASELRIFGSIVVPFCTPVLVTLAIFTFMGTWNDFLWPLIVLTGEDRQTLPVALANLAGEHVQDVELMMAGAVLTVLPIIVMFLALQRYYIEGIVSGSVKE